MKPALIAAILIAAFVYFAPRCYAEQKAAKEAQATTQQPQAGTAVVVKEGNQDTADHNDASTTHPPHWYKSPEWVLVIVGATTALFIGWQSFETRRAATATKQSVAEASRAAVAANRAMRIDQRAWVGVVKIYIHDSWRAHYPFAVDVHCKNTGKTPAKDVAFYIRMQSVLAGQKPDYSYTPIKASGIVFPGAENVTTIGTGTVVSAEAYNQVKTGVRTLFLHGKVEYKDVFGEAHWTEWCYYMPDGGESFTAYSEHNETDDQKTT